MSKLRFLRQNLFAAQHRLHRSLVRGEVVVLIVTGNVTRERSTYFHPVKEVVRPANQARRSATGVVRCFAVLTKTSAAMRRAATGLNGASPDFVDVSEWFLFVHELTSPNRVAVIAAPVEKLKSPKLVMRADVTTGTRLVIASAARPIPQCYRTAIGLAQGIVQTTPVTITKSQC